MKGKLKKLVLTRNVTSAGGRKADTHNWVKVERVCVLPGRESGRWPCETL